MDAASAESTNVLTRHPDVAGRASDPSIPGDVIAHSHARTTSLHRASVREASPDEVTAIVCFGLCLPRGTSMTPHSTSQVRLTTGEVGIEGAGPGLASIEAWAIALVALAILLVIARWATSRRSRTERPRQH